MKRRNSSKQNILNSMLIITLLLYSYKKYPKIKNYTKQIIVLKEYLKGCSFKNYLKLFGISGLNKESIEYFIENIKDFYLSIKNNKDIETIVTSLINDYFNELIKIAYEDFSIIFDHTNEFMELINLLNNNIDSTLANSSFIIEKDKLSTGTIGEKVRLMNDFYKFMGRDFLIDEKMLVDVFCIYKKNPTDEEKIFKYSLNSFTVRRNDKNYILVNHTGYVMDSITWIHETRHYSNHPDDYRSGLSFVLTESISYFEEFFLFQLVQI